MERERERERGKECGTSKKNTLNAIIILIKLYKFIFHNLFLLKK